MSISMNIHPNKKWKTVTAELYKKGEGACIGLTLNDGQSFADLSLHYGSEENREEFIAMFKEAVSKLP